MILPGGVRVKPAECLLVTEEPGLGREITLGKLIFVHVSDGTGYYAYVNDVTVEWDLMVKADAWGIAPNVLEQMRVMDIDAIHFCCKDEGVTYRTTAGDVRRFGTLCKLGQGRGAHWHLPRRFWSVTPGIQKYRRTHRVKRLDWLEPEVVR